MCLVSSRTLAMAGDQVTRKHKADSKMSKFPSPIGVVTLLGLLMAVAVCEVDDVSGPVVPMGGIGTSYVHKNATKKETMADKVGGILKQEFQDDVEEAEQEKGKTFNKTAEKSDATLETVVKVTHKSTRANSTDASIEGSSKGDTNTKGSSQNATEAHKRGENDVDRIIDSQDNEFVLSKSKELAALKLDPLLIRDLTILITTAAGIGMLFEAMGQPVINGYLIAGAVVGPGGLMLIKELVQVESLAQLGVQLLLFFLGMEFSITKMNAVGGVALIGGLIEALLFVGASALLAFVMGAAVSQGALLGALISLSSTSVVVKCLEASHATGSQYGQISIGTLILQDCTVGVMFALMPIVTGSSGGGAETAWAVALVSGKLALLIGVAGVTSRTVLPPLIQILARHASKDLFQIVLIAFCLASAWATGWLGLSQELGAFVAGVSLSMSNHHEVAMASVDGARNVFTTLFITSIGLVMSPTFLWEHLGFLALGMLAVFVFKLTIITAVVWMFKFSFRTALLVGLSLSQISEFAFVLLSMVIDLHAIPQETYLMLIGVTALSLLITPGIIALGQKWLLREGQTTEEKASLSEPLRGEENPPQCTPDDEDSPLTSSKLQRIQRRNKSGESQYDV